MQDYKVIVNKFIVLVGIVDKVKVVVVVELEVCFLLLEFDVCFNFEFFKEGSVLEDFNKGVCIVVGMDFDCVVNIMWVCYGFYICNYDKLMFMDVWVVELIKYVVNVMLVIKISFMNEMLQLVECLGVDIE